MTVLYEKRIIELDDGEGTKTKVLVETPRQGRPELYTEEYCHKLFKEINDYLITTRDIYTVTGLLSAMKIPVSRYFAIFEKHPEVKCFREYHEDIKSILEGRIAEDGIKGKTNATMSIFTLKNKHNWKDRQEIDVNQNINLTSFLDSAPDFTESIETTARSQ